VLNSRDPFVSLAPHDRSTAETNDSASTTAVAPGGMTVELQDVIVDEDDTTVARLVIDGIMFDAVAGEGAGGVVVVSLDPATSCGTFTAKGRAFPLCKGSEYKP
jgi:hypothetical protein